MIWVLHLWEFERTKREKKNTLICENLESWGRFVVMLWMIYVLQTLFFFFSIKDEMIPYQKPFKHRDCYIVILGLNITQIQMSRLGGEARSQA